MASRTELSVAQVGPYPPPHGGVQSNLVAIERLLRARGVACTAVNLTRHRRPDTATVYYPRSALDLLRLLVRLPHRIVHLHVGGELTARIVALAACCTLLPGKKAVLSFHSGGYPESAAGRAAGRWTARGLVLRRFDRVIAVNEAIAAMFRRFGVAEARLRTIAPHSAPPAAGALTPELAGFFRTHDPVLITVGLLEPEYDLPMQIDVMEGVLRRHPGAGLAICGSGSLEGELRARIASRPWGRSILLAGDVPHESTLAAIAGARLMLRTTLYDGDAVSVREALAFGLPVIATDNGMRPAGVELVPVRDAAALESAIANHLQRERPRQPAPGADPGDGDANIEAVLAVYREVAT